MPGTVIGKSLNLGYVGKLTRSTYNKVTSRMVKSILDGGGNETLPVVPFGAPVVINPDNTVSKFGTTGTGVSAATVANFGGFAVAEVKQMMTYGYGPNASAGSYSPSQPCDVLQEGVINVLLADAGLASASALAANAQAYIVTVAGGTFSVGDIVCSTTPTGGGTAVALTGAKFATGKIDSNNVVELYLTSQFNA